MRLRPCVRTVLARRPERGAVLVEFALIVPLAIGLILGTFTAGTAYFRKISVVDAVREGSRYGSSLLMGTGVGAAGAWEDSVRSRIVEASSGELTSSDVCVKLVYASGGTDCGVADPPGASGERTIRVVKVSATKPVRIEFLFLTLDVTVKSKLSGRYERDTG